MEQNRGKNAAQWFYEQIFRDERIRPRPQEPRQTLPSLLRAARSLENGMSGSSQSREAVFLKQGKLLANYEDDYSYERTVLRYFPTYQALTDEELRGYFSWRTRLRKGQMQKTQLSFAFLYIYELLNQIGVADPMDGFRKLLEFQTGYGSLDESVLPYLRRWLIDYAVYYDLDPGLLSYTPQVLFDRNITVLDHIREQDDQKVVYALKQLAGKWLERSKFYGRYHEDFDTVMVAVLRRVWEHYAKGCKRSMVEQYFGPMSQFQVRLFENAVFCGGKRTQSREYVIDERYIYCCKNGLWTVQKHACPPKTNAKLAGILKTIDAVMREEYGFPNPIRMETDTKWLIAIIREESRALLRKKQEAEAKTLRFDFSQLDKIRREAAATETKLYVEEEEPQEPEQIREECVLPQEEAVQEADGLLSAQESRLLRGLLYGEDLTWVRTEGLILSVLVDSINEKLYDTFADSVLLAEEPPVPVEDYIDDLKEMVRP